MPVYEDGDLDRIDEDLKSIVKGVELKITVVTNILIGSICYNKIEEKSTFMYNKLTSKQTNQIQNKSPYEEDDDSSCKNVLYALCSSSISHSFTCPNISEKA